MHCSFAGIVSQAAGLGVQGLGQDGNVIEVGVSIRAQGSGFRAQLLGFVVYWGSQAGRDSLRTRG